MPPLICSTLIGQLCTAPLFSDGEGNILPESQELIQQYHLGNVILFKWSNPELISPERTQRLTANIQQAIKTATGDSPLIMIDQEGGGVRRCLWPPFDQMPSAEEMGEQAREWGRITGKQMRSVGINCVLAPNIDLAFEPGILSPKERLEKASGISRSFGCQPEEIVSRANVFAFGLHQSRVLSCLKHFPGHGRVTSDSHHFQTFYPYTFGQWKRSDGLPYYQLASKSPMIMMGHIHTPFFGGLPASLSPQAYQFLREQIGFLGVVATDSLTMRGVTGDYQSADEAVGLIADTTIRAITAGADLVIYGDLTPSPGALSEAVQTTPKFFKDLFTALKEKAEGLSSAQLQSFQMHGEESLERINQAKKKWGDLQ
jgi:beta-N-acetylhexosaminidase